MTTETIKIIKFAGQTYDQPSLENLSTPELAKLYNEAAAFVPGTNQVKRFSDKPTALKRTWEMLKRNAIDTSPEVPSVAIRQLEEASVQLEEAPAPKKEPKAPKAQRGMYFMFPHRAQEEQKTPKKGTMRARLFQLLSREYGATFDQLLAATWGDEDMRSAQGCSEMTEEVQRKTCYEATRLIHYFNGFGLFHAENDHIFVFSTRDERAAIAAKHKAKGS